VNIRSCKWKGLGGKKGGRLLQHDVVNAGKKCRDKTSGGEGGGDRLADSAEIKKAQNPDGNSPRIGRASSRLDRLNPGEREEYLRSAVPVTGKWCSR